MSHYTRCWFENLAWNILFEIQVCFSDDVFNKFINFHHLKNTNWFSALNSIRYTWCTNKLLLFHVSYLRALLPSQFIIFTNLFLFLFTFSIFRSFTFFALLVEEAEQSLSLIDSASWGTGSSDSLLHQSH